MDNNLARIVDVFRAENAEKVILFGSRATGKARPASDYDVCVIMPIEPAAFRDEYDRLYLKLRGACPDISTDLVVYPPDDYEVDKDLPAFIAYEISKKGIVLYDKQGTTRS